MGRFIVEVAGHSKQEKLIVKRHVRETPWQKISKMIYRHGAGLSDEEVAELVILHSVLGGGTEGDVVEAG